MSPTLRTFLSLCVLLSCVTPSTSFTIRESSALRQATSRWQPSYFSQLNVGTGFTFDDGEQLLVSLQKPLGLVLEQVDEESAIVVAEVEDTSAAAQAGVEPGDILLAIQNMDVDGQPLEVVLQLISDAPRALNLRFLKLL